MQNIGPDFLFESNLPKKLFDFLQNIVDQHQFQKLIEEVQHHRQDFVAMVYFYRICFVILLIWLHGFNIFPVTRSKRLST